MHPLRIKLHNELHARPSIYFDGPANVYHVAFLVGAEGSGLLLDRLVGSGTQSQHGFTERDNARFKWERHGEFLTVTAVVATAEPGEPWPAFPAALSALMAAHASQVISAVQLRVEVAAEHHDLAPFGFQDPAGSRIGGQSAQLWSDFVLTDEGVCRVLMVNHSLNTYRLGRMVRRVLEQETYRMMALLGLPDAQALAGELERFEKTLSGLTERTARLERGETRSLLDDIAALSTDVTRRMVEHQQRLAATAAYADLVSERIAELRETHAGECQRFGVFIERRFRPAVRYCAAVQARMTRLTEGVAHLGDLLQARAQVELEAQNTQILESLNQRAQTQIKIQKAVEGVSVIAITYYLLSLLKLIYQGSETLGLVISSQMAVLACIPVTILVLWHSRHKIRKVSAGGSTQ